MENKKIDFFEEKKWIVLLMMKRQKMQKTKDEPEHVKRKIVWDIWKKWWEKDFSDGKNQIELEEIVKWIYENLSMSKEEIIDNRREAANIERVHDDLLKMAAKNGYIVQKAATSKHPLKVSGFRISKKRKKGRPQIIAGEKFDLTEQKVRQICSKPMR